MPDPAAANWIGTPRARAVLRVLLVAQVILLGLAIAGTHGAFGPVPPTSTAYISFYAAGRLALDGTPALAYDPATHHALEQALTLPGIDYKFFFYPPVFLLLCQFLAIPPYLVSFVVFEVLTLGGFLLALRRLLAETLGTPPKDWLVAALAYPPLYWALGWGQNAFLTAMIFTTALLLLDRRPFLAGLAFSALCYKPHFGLLLPVALLAGRQWAAIAGAALGVIALCAFSLLAFGLETWLAYLEAALGSGAVYESGRVNLSFYVTPFGAALRLGAPTWFAYALQAIASLAAVTIVALAWWFSTDLRLRAPALLAGTVLAVPLALLYDLMLLLPALAWLNAAARETGDLPGERAALAAIYMLPIAIVSLGMGAGIPIGPLASLGLLLLTLRRLGAAPSRPL